ncbi:hypothetical protein GGF32_008352 [Allomyces javanicus]|nr:hypothetical protein GGF32_008352 [Allomyces javanicus]
MTISGPPPFPALPIAAGDAVTVSANAAGPTAISRGHNSTITIGTQLQFQITAPGITLVHIKAATTRSLSKLDMTMMTFNTTTRNSEDDARLHSFLASGIAPADVIVMVGHGEGNYVPWYLRRTGGFSQRQVWARVATRNGKADAEVFVDGMLVTTHRQRGLALFSVYADRIGTVQWFDTHADNHVSEKLLSAIAAMRNEREMRVAVLVAFQDGLTQKVNDTARHLIRHVFNVRLMRDAGSGDGFCALVRLYDRWYDYPHCALAWMPADTPVQNGISRWIRLDL